MNEEEKAKELASGYREMMKCWAWQYFEKSLDEIRQDALERVLFCTDMKDVFLEKGKVQAVDQIKRGIGYVLEAK